MHLPLARRTLLMLTVLLLAAFWSVRRLSRRSTGIYAGLPAESSTLDCRDMVLAISKQHSVKINFDTVAPESLAARLKAIYSQRYKHVLLVRADAVISFQEVMGVVDIARGAVPDIQVVLLTPRADCPVVEGITKVD